MNQSAGDLLALGIYPNAKEVTESWAALHAVEHKLKANLKDPSMTVVAVGDGRSPRTASLFAFHSKWNCISIDPRLNTDKIPIWETAIQRLKCISSTVEEVSLSFDKVIIVAVHSHAPLPKILDHITANVRSMVAIPCCVSYNHTIPPSIEYEDAGIWSPENIVKIWRSI